MPAQQPERLLVTDLSGLAGGTIATAPDDLDGREHALPFFGKRRSGASS
jgi:hypothetical protein